MGERYKVGQLYKVCRDCRLGDDEPKTMLSVVVDPARLEEGEKAYTENGGFPGAEVDGTKLMTWEEYQKEFVR